MTAIYQLKNKYFREINWTLLLFLLLVLNVKMPVKIVTVIVFLLLNRRLFFQKHFYRQKFIGFYFVLIGIGIINLLLSFSSLSVNYLVVVATGILFWLLCAGAAFLNSWFVEKTNTGKLHQTISLFFMLNAIVTFGQLLLIILDAGSINPYMYQGQYQKYFIGTGDLMTGITFDVSTTNAILNAFAVVYFLKRDKMAKALLCMAVLLLTASNFTNVLVLAVLAFLFLFQSTRNQKSIIVACILLLIIFMVKISPQNDNYVIGFYNKVFNKALGRKPAAAAVIPLRERQDSTLSPEEKKQKIAILYLDSLSSIAMEKKRIEDPMADPGQLRSIVAAPLKKPSIPKDDIHSQPFQRRRDTTEYQRELLDYATKTITRFDTSLKKTKSHRLPGKLIAFQQTLGFLKAHPLKIITGDGIGQFSSKLAFRATGLRMAGGYPKKFAYTSPEFRENHLNLYLNYFSKDIEIHSLVNSPNSVYDQLISEYGIAGVLAFLFLYLAFFIKQLRKQYYGAGLLLILLGAFGVEYWYEQLSVVIVFELMMLLQLKEIKEQHE